MNCHCPWRFAKRRRDFYAVIALVAITAWAKHDYSIPTTTLSV